MKSMNYIRIVTMIILCSMSYLQAYSQFPMTPMPEYSSYSGSEYGSGSQHLFSRPSLFQDMKPGFINDNMSLRATDPNDPNGLGEPELGLVPIDLSLNNVFDLFALFLLPILYFLFLYAKKGVKR